MTVDRVRRTSRRIISVLALSALVAGMLAVTAASASAATECDVKNGMVSGSDLQAMIDSASTGDTIQIKGTCVGNFVIPGGGSATSLTLAGVRRAVSENTLDGNGSGSVLTIEPGTTVILKRLRITNGNAFQGGGIFNDHSTLRLKEKTRVIGNTATSDGGGIFNSAAQLFLNGKAHVNGNTAAGYGGGIYNNFGAITMSSTSQVNGNTTGITGGGIYNDGGALVGCTAGVNVKSNNPNDISP